MTTPDLAEQVIIPNLPWIIGGGMLLGAIAILGWVLVTWLRIKNGYPLETSWGVPLHPTTDREAAERIKLLTTENAQLRAEVGEIKDRLGTMERIVTDKPSQLSNEIEALRLDTGGTA